MFFFFVLIEVKVLECVWVFVSDGSFDNGGFFNFKSFLGLILYVFYMWILLLLYLILLIKFIFLIFKDCLRGVVDLYRVMLIVDIFLEERIVLDIWVGVLILLLEFRWIFICDLIVVVFLL